MDKNACKREYYRLGPAVLVVKIVVVNKTITIESFSHIPMSIVKYLFAHGETF